MTRADWPTVRQTLLLNSYYTRELEKLGIFDCKFQTVHKVITIKKTA